MGVVCMRGSQMEAVVMVARFSEVTLFSAEFQRDRIEPDKSKDFEQEQVKQSVYFIRLDNNMKTGKHSNKQIHFSSAFIFHLIYHLE